VSFKIFGRVCAGGLGVDIGKWSLNLEKPQLNWLSLAHTNPKVEAKATWIGLASHSSAPIGTQLSFGSEPARAEAIGITIDS